MEILRVFNNNLVLALDEHGRDVILTGRGLGFQARPGQQAMADAVATALEGGPHLLVQAGTGTGKTFAYLVPALQSNGKVIVSTGTKTLQGIRSYPNGFSSRPPPSPPEPPPGVLSDELPPTVYMEDSFNCPSRLI